MLLCKCDKEKKKSKQEVNIMYLYKHPIFTNYACDNSGNIINLKTGCTRKTHTPQCGYKELKIKNVHILVHRFVWEAYNNEVIPRGYEVHHINKNRMDNHPTNLEVLSIREHRILHKKGSASKMTFTDIINEAFKYYKITDNSIERASVVLKNTDFLDTVINEVNFTAKSFGLDDRLERGFNVTSLGDYVVVSPLKKRRD